MCIRDRGMADYAAQRLRLERHLKDMALAQKVAHEEVEELKELQEALQDEELAPQSGGATGPPATAAAAAPVVEEGV
eukprot:8236327-Pyramimonas_sp.AAC.1